MVAEALTNVAKYADATHARVDVRRAGAELVVEVRDDGVGGAVLGGGSGLRGLADRVGRSTARSSRERAGRGHAGARPRAAGSAPDEGEDG